MTATLLSPEKRVRPSRVPERVSVMHLRMKVFSWSCFHPGQRLDKRSVVLAGDNNTYATL